MPRVLQKWFRDFIHKQLSLRSQVSVEPVVATWDDGADRPLAATLHARYARGGLSHETWARVDHSPALTQARKPLDPADPALGATLDQLLERILRGADESTVASWIETYLQ
jgi:hypothetical protein